MDLCHKIVGRDYGYKLSIAGRLEHTCGTGTVVSRQQQDWNPEPVALASSDMRSNQLMYLLLLFKFLFGVGVLYRL